MIGDGEGHFLTQNNWGAERVDSWVTYGGSAPEWGVHQGEGGLLKGSRETWGGTQKEIRVAQSYGLFGQDTEIICEVEIVKKGKSIIRYWGIHIND